MTINKTDNELWVLHLTNQFFVNRFDTMTQCRNRFLSKLNKNLTFDDMTNMKHYPKPWDSNMTVFGYLTAYYPSIAISLEKTDEYDLITRLKIVKLLLKLNKAVQPVSKRKRERYEIKKDIQKSQAAAIEYVNYKEYKYKSEGYAWNQCK
jgi:hypothetical protein